MLWPSNFVQVDIRPLWDFLSHSPSASPLVVAAAVIAAAVTYLFTPLSGRLAHRLGILDHPDQGPGARKIHPEATPYLGGIAIMAGCVIGAVVLAFVPNMGLSTVLSKIPPVIGVAVILGIVGVADDVKSLPRVFRALAQVGAALLAWWAGFRVGLPWEPLNLPITLIWIVGITNAFNLLDNMDGLTAGVAGIAATGFATMGLVHGLYIVPIVASALAGACGGFLVHNRHPAKIFMGDAGSMFIGFLLALLGLELRFDNLLQTTFLVPVVVLGVPILDTTLVVLSRIRSKKPVFLGGRDHVSHRLIALGLPVREAVHLLYAGAFGLTWIALVISRSTVEIGYMLLAFVVGVLLYIGRFLWRIPVYSDAVIGFPSLDSERAG